MAKNVRIREPLTGSPTLEYLNERMGAGWRLVALEWERPPERDQELLRVRAPRAHRGVQSSDFTGRMLRPC